jgi:hypothetical protein
VIVGYSVAAQSALCTSAGRRARRSRSCTRATMCCPASSATIVALDGPFLGSNATTEARVSPVWTRIIASFPEMQSSPGSQHNDLGPFWQELHNPLRKRIFGTLWQSSHSSCELKARDEIFLSRLWGFDRHSSPRAENYRSGPLHRTAARRVQ